MMPAVISAVPAAALLAIPAFLESLPGILATVLGLGALIAAHEFGHLLLARAMGMRVEVYSIGFGPRLWGFKRGDTDYRLSAIPLGGYCRIAGFTVDDPAAHDWNDPGSYVNKPAWRRFLVIAAGPGVNWLCAIVIVAGLYVTTGYYDPTTNKVQVIEGGPAAAAGMQSGDRIVAIDGIGVQSFQDLLDGLRRSGPPVRAIQVERTGQKVTLQVKPEDGRIRVSQAADLTVVKFPQNLPRATVVVWQLTALNVGALIQVFKGSGGASVSGPVGIVKQAASALKASLADFVALLAQISVGLAVFNFLPVPALDGGRLVFLSYEVISRRRVNAQVEMVVNAAGALMLIALFLGITVFGDLGLWHRLFPKQ
jgi:regulator of sigma E protease